MEDSSQAAFEQIMSDSDACGDILQKMSDTDLQLLARYTRQHAEDAFAEIVPPSLDLVYSAALRQLRSPQFRRGSRPIRLHGPRPQRAPSWRPTRTSPPGSIKSPAAPPLMPSAAKRAAVARTIASEMNDINATAADWTHVEPLLTKPCARSTKPIAPPSCSATSKQIPARSRPNPPYIRRRRAKTRQPRRRTPAGILRQTRRHRRRERTRGCPLCQRRPGRASRTGRHDFHRRRARCSQHFGLDWCWSNHRILWYSPASFRTKLVAGLAAAIVGVDRFHAVPFSGAKGTICCKDALPPNARRQTGSEAQINCRFWPVAHTYRGMESTDDSALLRQYLEDIQTLLLPRW